MEDETKSTFVVYYKGKTFIVDTLKRMDDTDTNLVNTGGEINKHNNRWVCNKSSSYFQHHDAHRKKNEITKNKNRKCQRSRESR